MDYVPTLQVLQKIYWDGHQAAKIGMSLQFLNELKSTGNGPHAHMIDPTLLDAITHLSWMVLTKRASQLQPTGARGKLRG